MSSANAPAVQLGVDLRMMFDVPYYSQSSDFTCGPACVLMVMKHLDSGIKLGRALEFELWRQCNMIGVKGADPYGLSVPLIDAGYDVRLVTLRRRTVETNAWRRRLARYFSREEIELSIFGMRQNQLKALSRNLKVEYKRPMVNDIVEAVNANNVPIALVHMGVIHSLNIPHWVVVTGSDGQEVTFNDPYPPKGRKGLRLSHMKFQKMIDDIGARIGLSPSVLFVRRT